MNFNVAIVGRPNVGKSRLFNRLAGKRISIVHDMPGVTRDVITRDLDDGYTLMDTGGMGLVEGMSDTPGKIVSAVEGQIEFSIDAADLVLFVVDGREGLMALDKQMAERLRRSEKRVFLIVNKVDTETTAINDKEFYRYGFGEPHLVSAEHGRGMSALRREILKLRDEVAGPPIPEEDDGKKVLKVCFIGRPNVGKSSLSNCLVQSDRFIVSDVPGTTRDSIEMPFVWKSKRGEDWHFMLTDTAGIRKQTKLNSSVEYFSRVRSLDAIRDVDVVFMVIDAKEGPTNQDKAIAGEATKANKPVVIVVNKWDLALQAWEKEEIDGFETEKQFREAFEKGIQRELFFVPGSPIRFVSAKEGIDVEKILLSARQLNKRQSRRIPTGRLNNRLYKMSERLPAPKRDGKRFRIYYAVHTGNYPYRFKIFCNQAKKLDDSYRRFLLKGLVQEFELDGCPMVFDLVNKTNPYVRDED
ncbi:ribosome biogenesis GTPase Der [Pelagicoccus sp. SDUM812002]|uniref:ribosome biogenesis GTPase Der n=1 Tax=Pelagicoccus sp. SDUM812002 TaxID=3041266 RepID=UPI00281097AF|nr:ribosome biogenesis GTPase Der [Pelagicoccus sp. SDUM812002]MDQ8186727.1 ribosome biogenesis GTPase Der [Pelagicoccus sp. SDUM812002]